MKMGKRNVMDSTGRRVPGQGSQIPKNITQTSDEEESKGSHTLQAMQVRGVWEADYGPIL